jgi:O-methyltransferase
MLLQFIENSKGEKGSVCEIGVAKGDTSVFLLEHLLTTNDARNVLLVDTFQGFTKSSLEFEVQNRGKRLTNIDKFKYINKDIFKKSLLRLGYQNFSILQSDCSMVDWQKFGPFSAVLLDVDLYEPTLKTLRQIWPHIIPGGGIVVDDVAPSGDWDGSYQAYIEFCEENNLKIEVVGEKGGVLRKV